MSLWEERCNDVVKNIPLKVKEPTLLIISNIKTFGFEMYRQHGNSKHFKDILRVLRSSKNCTKDTKSIIHHFIEFCLQDSVSERIMLLNWKLLANLGINSRNSLLDTFLDELNIHKQNIAHQNDIIVLEKTKDNVIDELEHFKKEFAIISIERDRFRSQYLKLKHDFDVLQESNSQLIAKLSKCEHLEETNHTLLAIISNLSSKN